MHLVRLADTYLEAPPRPISESTLAKHAAGQAHFFRRLRAGAGITVARAARVTQWFSDHWPDGLAWPSEIPRPEPSPKSTSPVKPGTKDSENPLTALNNHGTIASPDAFVAALPLQVFRASYDQVLRQYADGRPRADKSPRRGTHAALILDHLVKAGDVRFSKRIKRCRKGKAAPNKNDLA